MTKPPKVGVVGTGRWGRNLVRNFAAQGSLGGLCDLDPETLQAVAALHPQVPVYLDFNALLAADGIDAVAIATPSASHSAMSRRAIESGKHVFVEKPMSVDLSEAQEIGFLAKRSTVTLLVGHLMLYHPAYQALSRLVRSGELGDLRYVYSHRLDFRSRRGDADALLDFAPHDLSMILDLIDCELISATTRGTATIEPGVTDTCLSQLTFVSGLQAHMFLSWVHPSKEQRLVVAGTRGSAVFDDGLPGSKKLVHCPHIVDWQNGTPIVNREQVEPVRYADAEPLALECAHFLECIATGAEPRSGIGQALSMFKTLDACQRSLVSGTSIALEPENSTPVPAGQKD